MTKLCINCVHFIGGKLGFSKCKRTEHIEPVRGKTDYTYCSDERRDYVGCCGPDAKFFSEARSFGVKSADLGRGTEPLNAGTERTAADK